MAVERKRDEREPYCNANQRLPKGNFDSNGLSQGTARGTSRGPDAYQTGDAERMPRERTQDRK